jgi:hypothetical protein
MPAALERRLQALEAEASEQTTRIIWVSWQPDTERHEIASAQFGGSHYQRQQSEAFEAFSKRVEQAARHQSGLTILWGNQGEAPICKY